MKKVNVMVGLVAAAILATVAVAEPTEQVVGGNTTVVLSEEFVGALGALGLTPAPIMPGTLGMGKVSYPIPGGALDLGTAKGDIFHTGGLSLTDGFTTVGLLNFIIDTTGTPVLTGLVTANDSVVARLPLFDLGLTQLPTVTAANTIIVDNVDVTLNEVAAGALNDAFNTGAFEAGFPIGTATVTAQGMTPGGGDDEDEDEDEDEDDDDDDDFWEKRRWRNGWRR